MTRETVDGIPLIYQKPGRNDRRKLIIWLNGFGGSKDGCIAYLEELAALGFTALSFDPWQHGERMIADVEALRSRVHSNIRRYFWPMLSKTAQETPFIIDWAVGHLGVDEVIGMGGISMGGDISVAAAGIDQRIMIAIPGVAKPDWLRPGTSEAVGEPDETAQAAYNACNPLTHLDRYAHCPHIIFQNGAEDRQVPPDGSMRFRDVLRQNIYKTCPERIDVVLHEGIAHHYDDKMWENTKALFMDHLS
jgi:dienelactone hydrolase